MKANLSTRLFAVGIAAEAMKGIEPTIALIEAATIAIATQALLSDDPGTKTRRLVDLTAGGQAHGETQ